MTYREGMDLSWIPDHALAAERGRRNAARRKTHGAGTGRPPILRPCPHCGVQLGAAALRAHGPHCTARQQPAEGS